MSLRRIDFQFLIFIVSGLWASQNSRYSTVCNVDSVCSLRLPLACDALRIFTTSMSPSRSIRSCRKSLGVNQFPTIGLSTPSPSFPATIRLRCHTSTMPPSPAYHAQHEIQKMASTTAEPVGQSGRRYLIERVLQEKGVSPRRVYLATCVLLKLNCQHYLSC